MTRGWITTGAFGCALSVVAGAFGAHALRAHLDPHALELWETAARYLFSGSVGTSLVGLLALQRARRGLDAAATMLVCGTTIFSTTVGALALGAPRWLGAVTPLGGLLIIGGFLVFGWSASRS